MRIFGAFISKKQFTHFWCIFVAKTIYALRPESFCAWNSANRKVLTFCVSGRVGGPETPKFGWHNMWRASNSGNHDVEEMWNPFHTTNKTNFFDRLIVMILLISMITIVKRKWCDGNGPSHNGKIKGHIWSKEDINPVQEGEEEEEGYLEVEGNLPEIELICTSYTAVHWLFW